MFVGNTLLVGWNRMSSCWGNESCTNEFLKTFWGIMPNWTRNKGGVNKRQSLNHYQIKEEVRKYFYNVLWSQLASEGLEWQWIKNSPIMFLLGLLNFASLLIAFFFLLDLYSFPLGELNALKIRENITIVWSSHSDTQSPKLNFCQFPWRNCAKFDSARKICSLHVFTQQQLLNIPKFDEKPFQSNTHFSSRTQTAN